MLLDRLFDATLRSSNINNPQIPLSSENILEYLGAKKSSSGVAVTRGSVLGYPAFWRGVNVISNGTMKLPLVVYKNLQPEGKERDQQHQAYKLLRRRPNPLTSAGTFKKTLTSHALIHGNGYAWIRRAPSGRVLELIILDPEQTFCGRFASGHNEQAGGQAIYITNVRGDYRNLLPENVLHIRGLARLGNVGYSVIDVLKESLGLGLAAQKYGAVFFSNGMRPSIIIEYPKFLKDEEAVERFRAGIRKLNSGLDNSHREMLLEDGATAKVESISNEDGQFLQTREFDVRQVANILGVAPHKLGDSTKSSYNSLEQENQSHLDDNLDPWLVTWEEECELKLLSEEEKETESHTIEFMRQALMRANMKDRYAAYNTGLMGGWLNRDEVRAKESMNPLPDGQGQIYLQPLNMVPAGSDPEESDPADPAASDDPSKDPDADPAADPSDPPQDDPVPPPPPKKKKKKARAQRSEVRDQERSLLTTVLKLSIAEIGEHARRMAKEPQRLAAWCDEDLEAKNRSRLLSLTAPAYGERASAIADALFASLRTHLRDVEGVEALEAELTRLCETVPKTIAGNLLATST